MQASADKIWVGAQQLLRTMLNTDIYNLWFLPIKAVSLDNETLMLEVANDFCEVWLKDNYLGLISDVLAQASGQNLKIKFRVSANGSTLAAPAAAENVKTKSKPVPDQSERNGAIRAEIAFNPKNTFESFVVGENNNHAHAAAMAVSQAPGKSYNPLFLYGGVGLGKTHLLHAIGQHVVASKKNARVAFGDSDHLRLAGSALDNR